jgi:hypothetical protein
MEGFLKIGKIMPCHSKSVGESRLGIGMEKLDRDAFDPEKVYDKVAALGVKWVRLQSGWQKTEQREGVYDFSWLDRQVDELRSRGLVPWLCLCYGNPLYDSFAGVYYGAVGCPPIREERAYNAWLRYVEATVRHFAGRIEYYEIWNEPDGKWTWRPQPDPREYAEFCVRTGRVIKTADPNARVITGSTHLETMSFFNECFANGVLEVADAISFHSYHYDESNSIQRIKAFRSLLQGYGKEVEIIQGETGSQSMNGGNGAFFDVRTNQDMQTKYILRHTVAEILSGVKFTSVFSLVDMAENLDAKAGGPITTCGYFGLLGADFDPNTGALVGEYREKPSYYAFQNLCALLNENVTPKELPVFFKPQISKRIKGWDCSPTELIYGGVTKRNGSGAFLYWKPTELTTVQGYEGTVTLELAGIGGEVRLIDPIEGGVYAVGENVMKDMDNGLYLFENIPVKDYPLLLAFGDFCDVI